MANWDEAASGAITGAEAGSTLGPWGAAAGGLIGGAIGAFDSKPAPQYTDPNADARRVLEGNLLNAKTGEDYAAHASALNEHRGQSMFDQVSKDFSGNPAVSSSIYNNIERNTENENTTAGIEGARINQDNQRTAANMMGQDSAMSKSIFDDNADRAGRPSIFDQVAGSSLTQRAGRAIGSAGSTSSSAPGSPSSQSSAPTVGTGGGYRDAWGSAAPDYDSSYAPGA